MDFKNINIIEILKLGGIGLAFLLALMSYNLIKKEQAKPTPSDNILKTTKFFMFFAILLMVSGVVSEIIKYRTFFHFKLDNTEIQINEMSYSSINSLDTKKYFISSESGFAFVKPNSDWTKIKEGNGLKDLFKLMDIKSELLTEHNFEIGMNSSPLGELLKNVKLYYFINDASKTNIIITDSTSNDQIDALVSYRRQQIQKEPLFNINKPQNRREINDEINEYKKVIIPFTSFIAKEAFVISVYPKSALPIYLKKLKLPAFFNQISIALGLNSDKLVANENQIIVGAEVKLKNVKANNKIIDFQSKKLMMFTENDQYFYIVEVTYVPQISSSTVLWDNLQDTFKSFTLLKD